MASTKEFPPELLHSVFEGECDKAIEQYLSNDKYNNKLLALNLNKKNIVRIINISYNNIKSNRNLSFNILFTLSNIIKHTLLGFITEEQLIFIIDQFDENLKNKKRKNEIYYEKIYKNIKIIVDMNPNNIFLQQKYIDIIFKLTLKSTKISQSLKIAIINNTIKNSSIKFLIELIEKIMENKDLIENFKIKNIEFSNHIIFRILEKDINVIEVIKTKLFFIDDSIISIAINNTDCFINRVLLFSYIDFYQRYEEGNPFTLKEVLKALSTVFKRNIVFNDEEDKIYKTYSCTPQQMYKTTYFYFISLLYKKSLENKHERKTKIFPQLSDNTLTKAELNANIVSLSRSLLDLDHPSFFSTAKERLMFIELILRIIKKAHISVKELFLEILYSIGYKKIMLLQLNEYLSPKKQIKFSIKLLKDKRYKEMKEEILKDTLLFYFNYYIEDETIGELNLEDIILTERDITVFITNYIYFNDENVLKGIKLDLNIFFIYNNTKILFFLSQYSKYHKLIDYEEEITTIAYERKDELKYKHRVAYFEYLFLTIYNILNYNENSTTLKENGILFFEIEDIIKDGLFYKEYLRICSKIINIIYNCKYINCNNCKLHTLYTHINNLYLKNRNNYLLLILSSLKTMNFKQDYNFNTKTIIYYLENNNREIEQYSHLIHESINKELRQDKNSVQIKNILELLNAHINIFSKIINNNKDIIFNLIEEYNYSAYILVLNATEKGILLKEITVPYLIYFLNNRYSLHRINLLYPDDIINIEVVIFIFNKTLNYTNNINDNMTDGLINDDTNINSNDIEDRNSIDNKYFLIKNIYNILDEKRRNKLIYHIKKILEEKEIYYFYFIISNLYNLDKRILSNSYIETLTEEIAGMIESNKEGYEEYNSNNKENNKENNENIKNDGVNKIIEIIKYILLVDYKKSRKKKIHYKHIKEIENEENIKFILEIYESMKEL